MNHLYTIVNRRLPSEAEARVDALTRMEHNLPLTSVKAEICHGRIVAAGTQSDAPLHAPTRELIGLRNLYT